jgi:hypothetical protein
MAKKRYIRQGKNKQKRNSIIVGVLLVFLMIFSVVGFAIQGSTNSGGAFDYNGFDFNIQRTQTNTIYTTQVNGVEIGFYNDPFFIESQSFSPELFEKLLNAQTITFTSNPLSDASLEGVDLRLYNIMIRDVELFSTKNIIKGYTSSDPFDPLPVRNCDDSSSSNVVFVSNFGLTNNSELVTLIDEYCYAVNGINFDFIVLRDYIIYGTRGIIR